MQVLLLDEPLAGLDWRARMEVAETLKQLKNECTILVVSHDLRELTPLVSSSCAVTQDYVQAVQHVALHMKLSVSVVCCQQQTHDTLPC